MRKKVRASCVEKGYRAAFSDIISFKRKMIRISRKKMSDMTGVSVHHISMVELNKYDSIVLTFEEYAKLCAFLNVSLDRHFNFKCVIDNIKYTVKPKRN